MLRASIIRKGSRIRLVSVPTLAGACPGTRGEFLPRGLACRASPIVGRGEHRYDFKLDQIVPVAGPLAERVGAGSFHELVAASSRQVHPTGLIGHALGQHAPLRLEALADSLWIALAKALDHHEEHGSSVSKKGRRAGGVTVIPVIDHDSARCYKHLLCVEGAQLSLSSRSGTKSFPTRPNQHSFVLALRWKRGRNPGGPAVARDRGTARMLGQNTRRDTDERPRGGL